jgi:hypothetical protein
MTLSFSKSVVMHEPTFRTLIDSFCEN